MYDFLIIGAGIVGLTIARELKLKNPSSKVLIVEKEVTYGLHASGRNSGVLHSGIYYPAGSLKARFCSAGAKEMREYCEEHGLPINIIGKVVIPSYVEDDSQLKLLYDRAMAVGAKVEIIDEQQLSDLEPEARTATGQALWSPDTAVIDPAKVLTQLVADLGRNGVEVRFNQTIEGLDHFASNITINGDRYRYGHLINTAGVYADRIAVKMGIGRQYSILPFKGQYFRLSEKSDLKINHLIYPVPDLRTPFLGVHYTTTISGDVYLGPTAMPVFGRENYKGFSGITLKDSIPIAYYLAKQYSLNKNGFRRMSHKEIAYYFKKNFAKAAQLLTPRLKNSDLARSQKVGIRPQLLDTKSNELVTDYVIENGKDSTHILNAISPAFTSSLVFARHVVNEHIYG